MASAAATHFKGPDGYYYAIMDFNYHNGHWSPKSDSRVQRYTKLGDMYFENGIVEWYDVLIEKSKPAPTSSYTVPAGGGGGGSPYFNGHDGYYYAKNEFNMTQRPPRPRYRHPPKKYMQITMNNGSDIYEQVVDHYTNYTTPAPSAPPAYEVAAAAFNPPTNLASEVDLDMYLGTRSTYGGIPPKIIMNGNQLAAYEGSFVYINSLEDKFLFITENKTNNRQILLKPHYDMWGNLLQWTRHSVTAGFPWAFVNPNQVHFKLNTNYKDGDKKLYYAGIQYLVPGMSAEASAEQFNNKTIFSVVDIESNLKKIFIDITTGKQVEKPQSYGSDPKTTITEFNVEANERNRRRRLIEEEAATAKRRAEEEERRRAFESQRIAAAQKKRANDIRRRLEEELAAELRAVDEQASKRRAEEEAAERKRANNIRRAEEEAAERKRANNIRRAEEEAAARAEEEAAAAERKRANNIRRAEEEAAARAEEVQALMAQRARAKELRRAKKAAAAEAAARAAAELAEAEARAAEIASIRANVASRLVSENRNRALTANATFRRNQRRLGLSAIAAAAAQQRAYNEAAAQPLNSTVSSLLSPGHAGLLNRFKPRQQYPRVIGRHSTIKNLMNRLAANKAIANAKSAMEAARASGSPILQLDLPRGWTPNKSIKPWHSKVATKPNAAGTGIRVPPPRALVNAANGLFSNPLLSASARKQRRATFDPTRVAALSGYSRIGAKPATRRNNNSGAKPTTTTRKNNIQERFVFNPMKPRGR